jgi:maltose O-acetyltransferase
MTENMTELEKLQAGLPYSMRDEEVNTQKLQAIAGCKRLNSVDTSDNDALDAAIRNLFGKVGKDPFVAPTFNCDNGTNIEVGDNFLANYNVTILDITKVTIGNDVMIGSNSLISTVNHPITPQGRRDHLGIASPVTIGNDVWLGGNVTILSGVTIGNNVVVAAGAGVTKDVADNSLVGGVPAKLLKIIPNDVE